MLCGGVGELIDPAFMKLVDAGYPPEVAWFECFYEVKLVTDLMFERGIAGAFAQYLQHRRVRGLSDRPSRHRRRLARGHGRRYSPKSATAPSSAA